MQVAEVQVLAEMIQRVPERVTGSQVRRARQIHAAGVRRMPRRVRLASFEYPVAGLFEGRMFILRVL